MKRFYCTICNKVKRVQNYPIIKLFSADIIPNDVSDRLGECNSHHSTPNPNPPSKKGKEVTFRISEPEVFVRKNKSGRK